MKSVAYIFHTTPAAVIKLFFTGHPEGNPLGYNTHTIVLMGYVS